MWASGPNRFKVSDSAKITYWSDMTDSRVQTAIAKVLYRGKPLKTQTRNHYWSAVKGFYNWMVDDGRASSSPLTKTGRQAVTDQTERRALSTNELGRLFVAAEAGPYF